MIVLPHQVVPEGRQDEPPGQDGEAEHQAGDDWENHRDQEINEEGDEGPEGEDGGHDDDDEHVGDQPGQEELSPGQLDSHVEEDGGGQVGERGEDQEGEERAGVALHLLQQPQHAPADLKQQLAGQTGGLGGYFAPFLWGGLEEILNLYGENFFQFPHEEFSSEDSGD